MRKAAIGALFVAALGTAACETYYDDYGRHGGGRWGGYDYVGGDYDRIGNDCGFFRGSGGGLLDPWLACTQEGQGIVRAGFDRGKNRRISEATAERANIWFRRHADTDRDLRLTDPEVRIALVNGARHLRR
jgi:hypothetical protein